MSSCMYTRWEFVHTQCHKMVPQRAPGLRETRCILKIYRPCLAQELTNPFTMEEMFSALKLLKAGKAPGPDIIHPEFLLHTGDAITNWLHLFLSSSMDRCKIPKVWRRATVIALPKPNKPTDDPKSYRPISLLCIPYKLLERLIHARINPIIDPQLPHEQAGFRQGRSTVDQVILLTQDIEDTYENREKAGAVIVDLTAAYDTVWHRGLTAKLLRLLPDRNMVRCILNLISNRSFVLKTSDGQQSRLRRLNNGVLQGSVLAPLLFNTYIYDLPETTSKKYGYADDLAILAYLTSNGQTLRRTSARIWISYQHTWGTGALGSAKEDSFSSFPSTQQRG